MPLPRAGPVPPLDARRPPGIAIIGSTPGGPATHRSEEDDITTSPEPPQPPTPADRAEGTISEDDYLGRDGGSDGGADGGADDGADGAAGSGVGGDDPTTETDEDTRFA